MRSEPMIAVKDVQASSAWYCRLFGGTNEYQSGEFDRILHEGQLLVMLREWGGDEHGGALFDARGGRVGNGVVLWFLVPDLDIVYAKAESMEATITVAPHDNPVTHWREFTLLDPDGYTLSIAETGWNLNSI